MTRQKLGAFVSMNADVLLDAVGLEKRNVAPTEAFSKSVMRNVPMLRAR